MERIRALPRVRKGGSPEAETGDSGRLPLDAAVWRARRSFACRILRMGGYGLGREEVEDLAQEALIDMFEATRHRAAVNPEGLLRKISHRRAIDHLIRRKRWAKLVEHWSPEAEAIATTNDPLHQVILDALPVVAERYFSDRAKCLETMRAVFLGKAWAELGEEVGVRPNTLAQRAARCLKELAEHLADQRLGSLLGVKSEGP